MMKVLFAAQVSRRRHADRKVSEREGQGNDTAGGAASAGGRG
jgi:hypothetical protein